MAARLLPMPASILPLVFIYYLQTRLADQSNTQVVTHLFCLCKLYEYDYRGGGLMVMVVSWLWWAVGWTKTLELWINRWLDYTLHC